MTNLFWILIEETCDILFSSKFQNLFFYQNLRPNTGLKLPLPLVSRSVLVVRNIHLTLDALYKHIIKVRIKVRFNSKYIFGTIRDCSYDFRDSS